MTELWVRAAAVVAIALLACVALRGARASLRHLVLAAAVIGQLALPLVDRVAPVWEVPLADRWPTAAGLPADDAAGRAASSPFDVGGVRGIGDGPGPEAAGPAPRGRDLPAWAWVWGAGAALLFARLGAALALARAAARSGRPVAGPGWDAAIREAAGRAGVGPPPPVRLVDRSTLPVTCGVLRPTVLLPAGAEGWSARRRVLVLTHEMAHVARRDVAVQAAARLACAAFWPNPLAWVALARLRAEAERAADDVVLRGEPGPGEYVGELVALLRTALHERRLAGAVGFGRGLEARVRGALDGGSRAALSRPARLGVAAVALAVTAAVGSAGSGTAPTGPGIASGCVHVDGRHVNRWAEIDGAPTWQVLWEGAGCAVELRARPDVDLVDGILVPASPGAVTIRIERGGVAETLAVERAADGALRWRVDGEPPADPSALAARLRALADEIDLHTGFDARSRVPALLRDGGVDAVLARADAARGDHAAGVYLERLLDARPLDGAVTARALRIAAARVESDAVMEGLLLRLAREADLGDPAVRSAFDAAYATLDARAARESVRSAIR